MKMKKGNALVIIICVILLVAGLTISAIVIKNKLDAREAIVEQNPLIDENTITDKNNETTDNTETVKEDEKNNDLIDYPISNVVVPPTKVKQNTPIIVPIVNNPIVNIPPIINVPVIEEPIVNLDKVLPVINIDNNGTSGYVKQINVNLVAQDNVGISKIKYAVTTSKTVEPTSYITNNSSNVVISFPSVGDNGEYYIWYYAVDTSGNSSVLKVTEAYKIDNTLPTASIDNSGTGAPVQSASANITGNDVSGISKIMYKVVPISNPSAPSVYDEAVSVSNVTINFPSAGDNGEYYIWYYVIDNAGNESVPVRTSGTFKIDTIAPILNLGVISFSNNVLFNNDGTKHIDIEKVKDTATNEPIDSVNLKVYLEVKNDLGDMIAAKHQLVCIANPIPIFGDLFRSNFVYTSGTHAVISLWVEDLAGNKTYIFLNRAKTL